METQLSNTLQQWIDDGIAIILQNAKWHIGKSAISKATDPYMRRFNCCYFMQHEKYPDCIKIGITINLRTRLRSFKSELGSTPTVLCVIETDEAELLETLLHRRFSEYTEEGEWFIDYPILDWLFDNGVTS